MAGMDKDMARDLARQLREHLKAQDVIQVSDEESFDLEVLALIKAVEDQCAKVVENTPAQLFLIATPQSLLGLIAASVRGTI